MAQYEQYEKEGYNDEYWAKARRVVNNTSPHVSLIISNNVLKLT
jgi:hypothetical protein